MNFLAEKLSYKQGLFQNSKTARPNPSEMSNDSARRAFGADDIWRADALLIIFSYEYNYEKYEQMPGKFNANGVNANYMLKIYITIGLNIILLIYF